jgi:hypothetical protein
VAAQRLKEVDVVIIGVGMVGTMMPRNWNPGRLVSA